MRTKDGDSPLREQGRSFLYHCLICRRGLVQETPIDCINAMGVPRPPGINICRDCRDRYLSLGVALVNPETESVIVIMDSAYKVIFNEPIPEDKIVRVEEELIEQLYTVFQTFRREEVVLSKEKQMWLN